MLILRYAILLCIKNGEIIIREYITARNINIFQR
jgi:hypothetical protein